jgi:hypothetical protein
VTGGAHGGRERERQRDQPRVGIARLRELRRLRDVLAEDELAADPIVELFVSQRGDGGAPVWRVLGIRDRDPSNAWFGEDREPASEVEVWLVSGPEDDGRSRIRRGFLPPPSGRFQSLRVTTSAEKKRSNGAPF